MARGHLEEKGGGKDRSGQGKTEPKSEEEAAQAAMAAGKERAKRSFLEVVLGEPAKSRVVKAGSAGKASFLLPYLKAEAGRQVEEAEMSLVDSSTAPFICCSNCSKCGCISPLF